MEDPNHHDAWQLWFHEHGPRLLLVARQWTRSLADAEDVLQDAFIRYWRHQRHLGGEARALLVTSIRRAAIDLGRREGRRAFREQQADHSFNEGEPLFECAVADDERRESIESALRRLPKEQCEVLVLKIWGGLTFEEIGDQLAISPNTAASRHRYALAALRKELTPVCHG
ncbi:MAG: hypothetical protein A3G75_14500 [Verrucomicrobia bacterium RIFCSPLOWO2_12_FULL_64_8]|nr:MAG: hypothetical protein A3G75_14500 [Verrucomicrobia bacterium RIFCSPLOWO2_12_FULL_64_8]